MRSSRSAGPATTDTGGRAFRPRRRRRCATACRSWRWRTGIMATAGSGSICGARLAVNHKRVLRLLRGQSLVPAQEGVRAGDQRQPAWLDGLPAPGAPAGADRHQSALGGGRHRHPAGRGLRLSVGAYSRRIVGWAIPEHLRASLALAALEMALASRVVIPGGLVHRLSLISCRSPSASAPSPALELTDKPASAARQNLTRASDPLQCDHERRENARVTARS